MASSPRIEELRKKFEENPRRYFAPLANEYRKAGEIEQAISICREYLPQQPGHMSGHIVYGQALYEARQFEEAKSVFETALTLDPENLIALRHLGDIALIIGDNDAARGWYRRVLEADPRNEEIQAQLARIDAGSAPTPAVGVATPAAAPAAAAAAPAPSTPAPPAPPAAPANAATTAERPVQPWAKPKPTPSSAPTVVQAAVRPPAATAPVPTAPPANPAPTPVTAESPTAEIRLDELPKPAEAAATTNPPAAPSAGDGAQRLELDSVIPGTAPGATSAPSGSFSLDGLETTSLAGEPPASAPTPASAPAPAPAVPTLELDMPPAGALPTASAAPPPELPELRLSVSMAVPAAANESVPELLDLSATAPASPAPSTVPAAPATPAPTAATPSPALEDLIIAPEPAADSAPPESGPFVTETMAELYLKQGHRDEALKVYRALLEQRPGDATLQGKVAALQQESVGSAAASAAPAAPARSAPNAPTIREVLSLVATRRPGFRPQGKGQNGSAPAAAASPTEGYDAIGAVFGGAPVSDVDESAARTLALAFATDSQMAAMSASGLLGAPARVASTELSLDSVFSGDAPAAPSTFSFDQFFSKSAAQQDGGAAAAGGAESPEDVAQFTSWLQGLKQR